MSLFRRLRHLLRRRQAEAEMAEEMRFHLEQRAADYAAGGLSVDEARHAARRKFGHVDSVQEQARDQRGWGWLERGLQDLRFAFRQLARAPGFSVLAIVTLGLGIGANTAMFSVLNAIILKPLPYADAARLDRIDRATPQNPEGRISPADFLDFRRELPGYSALAAYALGDTSLAEPGRPAEMVDALRVTANFLSTLGLQPQRGRDFRVEEDAPGSDRVLLISERCWRNRFGGRSDIIGRTVRVDGEPHEIVGILPTSFNDWRHLGWVDVMRPLALTPQQSVDRQSATLRLLGRRAPEATADETASLVAAFGARLAADHPELHAGSSWRRVSLVATVVGKSGPSSLVMLIGLSGFVLLIACSNLANLLLARAIARSRELAVRSALGASRLQLLRPLAAEALLLALAGGACALLVALWAGDWLSLRSTGDNGERVVFTLDWPVFAWALGASLATSLAFGLAPALFALRLNLNATLKSGGRGAPGGRGQQRFRQLLIVGQFALAMVLLAGAALFIRGLHELNHRRAGWSSEHLVTGSVVLPAAGYRDADKITAFHRLVVQRLEALPGVASASVSSFTPFFTWSDARKYLVEGREPPERGREPSAVVNSVSPGYFDTVGTRVLAGRAFDGRDTAASPRVFIINQAMAAAWFGDADPIGRRIAQAGVASPQWGEVVGVVADVTSVVADEAATPFQLYQPMVQEPRAYNEIAVRTTGGAPAAVVDSIRSAMTALDPDLPVRGLQPADATIRRANYQIAVLRDLLAAFAVLGLGLASLGVYGVIARTMAQRTSEFAIRVALGASLAHISRLVLASGVKLALVGAALGLLGALGVTQLLGTGFPGMRLDGPAVLAGATLALVAVALAACWLPARRAGKVDPMLALRAE